MSKLNSDSHREMVKDRGAWCAAVHGVAKSRTRPSDRTAATALSCVFPAEPAAWQHVEVVLRSEVGVRGGGSVQETHLFRRGGGRPVCTAACGRGCVSSRLGGDRARETACPPSSSGFLLKTLEPQVSSRWEMECPSVTCSLGIKPGFSEGGVLSGAAAMADGAAASAAK